MGIGQKIIHLNSVDSTSNYIANLVKRGEITHGAVILADDQYAGKGQRGSDWVVKPGENLTFSFYLSSVNLSVDDQFRLTQMVALSITDFLATYEVEAKIKWPNDIYCNGKKIAGVLIENQLSGSLVKSSIVGVGLNVNQLDFSGFTATSIALETGQPEVVKDALFRFIYAFNERWNRYFPNSMDALQESYMSKLYRLHEWAEYADEDGNFMGRIVDVSTSGKLQVEKNDGMKKNYEIKEIRFLN